MKTIIAGSRTIEDYDIIKKNIELAIIKGITITEIVSGHARGVDLMGERYAQENGIKLTIFKAKWVKYGRSAGMIRNQEMVDYADAMIAIYDGKSKGTKQAIKCAKKKGIPTIIGRLPE